ncbi:MAG TPA: hypothetical protein VH682_02255 [Gemmataceae bacterium]|jgi:hypothetical protein
MALPHTKTSGAARTAVIYITIGAILDVWMIMWYIWMARHGTTTDAAYFWCYGFFFTGLILIVIGLALGKIGRFARHAEAPADSTESKVAPPPQSAPLQLQQPNAQPGAQPATPPVAAAPPAASRPAAAPGGTVSAVVPPPSRAGTPGSR